MNILKIDKIKVSHERDAGFDIVDTINIIDSKKELFKTFSESAKYYVLPEAMDFDATVKYLYSKEFLDKVQKGGN